MTDQNDIERIKARTRLYGRITMIAVPVAILMTIISVRIGGALGPFEAFALALAAASTSIFIMNRKRVAQGKD